MSTLIPKVCASVHSVQKVSEGPKACRRLYFVHTFRGAQFYFFELVLGCWELHAHLFWPGSHFMHTLQGSDPESLRTSFAPCAHCPSVYRMPGPARRSIECVYLFLASGPASTPTACGGRMHAGRGRTMQPSTSEASCHAEATRPRSGSL